MTQNPTTQLWQVVSKLLNALDDEDVLPRSTYNLLHDELMAVDIDMEELLQEKTVATDWSLIDPDRVTVARGTIVNPKYMRRPTPEQLERWEMVDIDAVYVSDATNVELTRDYFLLLRRNYNEMLEFLKGEK